LTILRGGKTVIGHRGAASYAPENTLAAFELALQQGADAVEQDLQVTRDGVLVCLHDPTLERTTNVRDVYPERGRDGVEGIGATRHWFVHDFTLEEVERLDAGEWFAAEFAGSRVPTFQSVLDWVGDRATLLAELKDPDVYNSLGVDVLSLVSTALAGHRIARSRSGEPLVSVQSFDEATVRRAAEMFDRRVPVVLLVEPADAPRWCDPGSLAALASFASGIGPGKAMLESHPEIVEWAHEARLRVTPWTFRAGESGRFGSVTAEMSYYLSVLDVDAVITDNPDKLPRELTSPAP
jgi:glycerophosphoryl diester phosphodiesterase